MRGGRKAWTDYLELLAAVQADSRVSCMHVLADRTNVGGVGGKAALTPGLPRYVVLGDESGRVYLFSPRGDLAREFYTGVWSGNHSSRRFYEGASGEHGSEERVQDTRARVDGYTQARSHGLCASFHARAATSKSALLHLHHN